MSLPPVPCLRAGPVGAAARAVAGRGRVNLAIVRFRDQPTAQFIARLTATAIFAYLLASLLPGGSQPVLAPLTAVLVVPATLYPTVRRAVQRGARVLAGVLVAPGLSAAVGVTWVGLGLTTAAGPAAGSRRGRRRRHHRV